MITQRQREAAYRYWDSYIPLTDEVIAQYHEVTTFGREVNWDSIPSYDWHVLDDLLSAHRLWPWVREQELKERSVFKIDVDRMLHKPCRDKWYALFGWEGQGEGFSRKNQRGA